MTDREASTRVFAIIDTYWHNNRYTDADVVRSLRANPVVLLALLGVEEKEYRIYSVAWTACQMHGNTCPLESAFDTYIAWSIAQTAWSIEDHGLRRELAGAEIRLCDALRQRVHAVVPV